MTKDTCQGNIESVSSLTQIFFHLFLELQHLCMGWDEMLTGSLHVKHSAQENLRQDTSALKRQSNKLKKSLSIRLSMNNWRL